MKKNTVLLILGLGLIWNACDDKGSSTETETSDTRIENEPLSVLTQLGPVRGTVEGESRRFLGIPYAAAPIGENRFAPPRPASPWTQERDATVAGPVCPQADMLSEAILGEEDCLTLNIFTPAMTSLEPRAVMVYFHGGVFVQGSGSDPMYDGSELAARGDVIVVTLNYRIGALGFLSHPALVTENEDHKGAGNYGIMDQQQALRFVRDNIEAFGGNPENMTLFGESVGAVSAGLHLFAPASQGLFKRIAMQSGSPFIVTLRSQQEANAVGQALAEQLGCASDLDPLACLRSLNPSEFIEAYESAEEGPGGIFLQPADTDKTWHPTLDSVVFTEDPLQSLALGKLPDVEVLLGTNKQEGTIFLSGLMNAVEVADASQYSAMLSARFGSAASDIESRYPLSSFDSPDSAAAELIGDAFFVCPARRTARLLSRAGIPTYLYSFERGADPPNLPQLGVCHVLELMFVFGHDTSMGAIGEKGRALANAMGDYWSNFARKGDPNTGASFSWPRYYKNQDELLVLDLPLATRAKHKSGICDFWDSLE
ncbi:MAG: carboxylesterase family protein [Myxococcota bacterium]|jgi:para-nitrobenzyl esterase|nr:carboxylesterase family protein [Myxococcota bacterium]